MLRESRHENLKILIAPLSMKLSSLKSTGTLSAVVLKLNTVFHNKNQWSYFMT